MKRDIHSHQKRYERFKENIKNGRYITVQKEVWREAHKKGLKIGDLTPDKLGKENQEVLLKFIDLLEKQLKPRPASPTRIGHYLRFLSDICRWLDEKGKNLANATNEDLKEMLRDHVSNNSKYSEWTKTDYRVALSKLYRLINGIEDGIPEQLKGIPTSADKNKLNGITANDILSPPEVQEMIAAAGNTMFKVGIAVLFESGMRVGEFLSLDYSSVQIKNGEATIVVPYETKTGQRTVYLYLSVPLLVEWMNQHPTKKPDAPLWVSERSIKSGKIKPLNYANFRKHLKIIARRAGINKKVYPHLFRHSIASYHAAAGLPHKLMCRQFGWSEQNSSMPNWYSKISDTQLKAGLRQSFGLPLSEEEMPIEVLKNKACPSCGGVIYGGQAYCKCGQKLDVQSIGDKKEELKGILKELLSEASPRERKELMVVLNKEEAKLDKQPLL